MYIEKQIKHKKALCGEGIAQSARAHAEHA